MPTEESALLGERVGGGGGGGGRPLSAARDWERLPPAERRISKDFAANASIRYSALAGVRQSASKTEPKALVMGSWRSCAFLVGVVYSVVSLGIAAATLGYRFDVENDGHGFRSLMEGTALLATVTFIASLGLVYGVIERRSGFVSAWLVLQLVVPLYTAAFYLWAIFASGDRTIFGPVRTAVPISAIAAAAHVLAMIGCTIAVNNYYTYLKLRETLKKNDNVFE